MKDHVSAVNWFQSMNNLLLNKRDQKFILYEMLDIEQIFKDPRYRMFSRESFDMVLATGLDLALNECYPAMRAADSEGCRFKDGAVSVPSSYHHLKKLFDEGGWSSLLIPQEYGGQGFSTLMYLSACEAFMHNVPFFQYTNRPLSTSDSLVNFGSNEQKSRYLKKLAEGSWGGPVALTEADAGSDIGMISAKAIKQPDGSYRISGTKITITNGDSDLFENYIYTVGARVEGAPVGMGGISLFLIPKYHINEDGTSRERNDYAVSGLDKKMGWNGLATCTAHFGENGKCYGELIGSENTGIFMIAAMMVKAQLNIALFSTGIASASYLHSLNYAKERVQGVNISQAMNPSAQRVPIVEHLDIKHMLLSMKSKVEGMRAFVYYCGFLNDQISISQDKDQRKRFEGLRMLLTPVCTAFCSDTAFDVTRDAMQVYGAAGYFKDYPMEQFMRDVKAASVYEGSNGVIALRMLTMNMGKDFRNLNYLLEEISNSIVIHQEKDKIKDIADDLKRGLDILQDTGDFIRSCSARDKSLIPIAYAPTFLKIIGTVTLGWLLFKQACISLDKLSGLNSDPDIITEGDHDIEFYSSKILVARYYCKHNMPLIDALSIIIKHGDMTVNEMKNEMF